MTREEKIERAAELRAEGKDYKTIAAELGVGSGTAYRWLNPEYAERQREKSRAWKQNNKGACIDCGGPTNASRGLDTHMRCDECSKRHRHEVRYWTPERCVAALRLFARRHGRQPIATDFLGGDPSGEQREVFYRDGDYPHRGLVEREFGCWNAGLRAAGFEPTREFTRPYERNPEVVLAEICARYAAGESGPAIAARLGISGVRIYQLLDKAGVPRRSPAEANRLAREQQAVAA